MPILRKKPNPNATLFPRAFGCPETRNRSGWCFDICTPVDGMGPCGRPAPALLDGRTRSAIRKFELERRARRSA